MTQMVQKMMKGRNKAREYVALLDKQDISFCQHKESHFETYRHCLLMYLVYEKIQLWGLQKQPAYFFFYNMQGVEIIDSNYNGDTQKVKKGRHLFREHISASLNQLPL